MSSAPVITEESLNVLFEGQTTTQEKVIAGSLQARLAVLLNGDPGIGKTATIYDIAARNNWHVIPIIGGRKDPAFVEGLPIIRNYDDEGKPLARPYTITTKPDWFVDAQAIAAGQPHQGHVYDGVVLFFDEFRATLEDVQAALLTFIQDRELDGEKLHKDVHIILAANPVETGANAQYIAPPMANRLIHIEFDVPVDTWLQRLPHNFNKPATEAELVEFARGAAYLRSNLAGTGVVNTVVPSDPAKADGAYPSRRSWVNTFRLLAAVGSDRGARDMAMLSTVGEDAALAFKTWDESLNLPTVEEILANHEKMEWDKFTTDKVFAISTLIVAAATAETVDTSAKVLVTIGNHHEALASISGRELIQRTVGLEMPFERRAQVARVLADKFRDILNAASSSTSARRA